MSSAIAKIKALPVALALLAFAALAPSVALADDTGYESVGVVAGSTPSRVVSAGDYWRVTLSGTHSLGDADMGHVARYELVDVSGASPAAVPCDMFPSNSGVNFLGYDDGGTVAAQVNFASSSNRPHTVDYGNGPVASMRQPFPMRFRLPSPGEFVSSSVRFNQFSLLVSKSLYPDAAAAKSALRLQVSIESPEMSATLPALAGYADGFRFASQRDDGTWMTDAELDAAQAPGPDSDHSADSPAVSALADGFSAVAADTYVAVADYLPTVIPAVGIGLVAVALAGKFLIWVR